MIPKDFSIHYYGSRIVVQHKDGSGYSASTEDKDNVASNMLAKLAYALMDQSARPEAERNKVLEECALLCEAVWNDTGRYADDEASASECARRIRELKLPQPQVDRSTGRNGEG